MVFKLSLTDSEGFLLETWNISTESDDPYIKGDYDFVIETDPDIAKESKDAWIKIIGMSIYNSVLSAYLAIQRG